MQDSSQSLGNNSLQAEQIKDFKEAFSLFDPKGQGFISSRDLGTVMRNLGQNPSDDEIAEMIKEADEDGNGRIDFDEFVQMMKKQMKNHDTERELKEAFNVFDKNRNGKISPCELRAVMQNLGEELSREELKEMMKEADTNGDGYIDFEEFITLVKTLDQSCGKAKGKSSESLNLELRFS